MSESKTKLKPVGFNLTRRTKVMLYEIAAYLHTKRTHAVVHLFDLLFKDLKNDKGFKDFVAAYDRIDRTIQDESSYTSFYIPKEYLDKFHDIMYEFKFIDRSPFLRLIIDYVYNNTVKPIGEDSIERVKKDLINLNYEIQSLGPILDGDIYIHVKNPYPTKSKRKK